MLKPAGVPRVVPSYSFAFENVVKSAEIAVSTRNKFSVWSETLRSSAHYDKEDHHYYYDSNLLLWYNSEKINNHVYEEILIDAVLKPYGYRDEYRIYSENEFTHNGFTYRICAEYFSENSYKPHSDYVPVSYDLFVYNDDACFLFRGLKYYDRLPSKEYITSFGFLPISEE